MGTEQPSLALMDKLILTRMYWLICTWKTTRLMALYPGWVNLQVIGVW